MIVDEQRNVMLTFSLCKSLCLRELLEVKVLRAQEVAALLEFVFSAQGVRTMVVKARNKKRIEMPATSAELEDRFSEDNRAEQADDPFERFH